MIVSCVKKCGNDDMHTAGDKIGDMQDVEMGRDENYRDVEIIMIRMRDQARGGL